MSTSATQGGHK